MLNSSTVSSLILATIASKNFLAEYSSDQAANAPFNNRLQLENTNAATTLSTKQINAELNLNDSLQKRLNYANAYSSSSSSSSISSTISTSLFSSIRSIQPSMIRINNKIITNDSASYYIVGVLFMVSIIGLLLYVNLYYEYCFRDTCYQMSRWRICCFLKYFFTIHYYRQPRASTNSMSNQATSRMRASLSQHERNMNVGHMQHHRPSQTSAYSAAKSKSHLSKSIISEMGSPDHDLSMSLVKNNSDASQI
jgi:hypothetical protein